MQYIEVKIIDEFDASRSEIAYWIHYFDKQIKLYKEFIMSDDFKYDEKNKDDVYTYKLFTEEIKLLYNVSRELKNYGANKEHKITTVVEG